METSKTGAYLAALRKAQGKTQQDVAGLLHISNKTVSKWESGGGFPDITVLPALAELYGVTSDNILAGESGTVGDAEAPGPEPRQRRAYLLQRAEVRFDLIALFALVCAILSGLWTVPYVSDYVAPILCPALLAAGWILLRPALHQLDAQARATHTVRAFRLMFAVLFLWEFRFRNSLTRIYLWKHFSADNLTLRKLAVWQPAANWLLAAVTLLTFAFLLRRTTPGSRVRLVSLPAAGTCLTGCAGAAAVRIRGALVTFDLETKAIDFNNVAEAWSEKLWAQVHEIQRPYLLAERVIWIATAVGLLLLLSRRRRKRAPRR